MSYTCRPIVAIISGQIVEKLKQLEQDLAAFLSSQHEPVKAKRLLIKMSLNKKVTQISQTSSHVNKISSDILDFSSKECMSEEEQKYFVLVLAQKLIEHGESLVCLHPPSAFSLSSVAIEVGKRYPFFMDILFASFYRRSIYTVPKFVADATGSNTRSLFGFKGDDETREAFGERMCGMVYLFGAVLGTPFVDGRLIEYAWVWLASLLNMKPDDFAAAVLCSFLEVTSFAMHQRYGGQFLKLVHFIRDEYLSMLPERSVAANTRLRLTVERMLQHREYEMLPEGALLVFK